MIRSADNGSYIPGLVNQSSKGKAPGTLYRRFDLLRGSFLACFLSQRLLSRSCSSL